MMYHCVSVQSIGKFSNLKTNQLGDSPFYSEKTKYGGAATVVRKRKVRNTPYQVGLNKTDNLLFKHSC